MKSSSGNVLFIILIAVALFATLSYAITSSTRTSGSGVSKEKARANASSIIQYKTAWYNAILRMKISNNCKDDDINIYSGVYVTNSGAIANTSNALSPPDHSCDLFHSKGGALFPIVANKDISDINNPVASGNSVMKPGHSNFRVYQVVGVGTDGPAGTQSANDLISTTDVNLETCLAANDIMGIENPGGLPPLVIITPGSVGVFENGSFSGTAIRELPGRNGNYHWCQRSANSTLYNLLSIIIAR
nr:hypothetical protein [Brucella intermedia]